MVSRDVKTYQVLRYYNKNVAIQLWDRDDPYQAIVWLFLLVQLMKLTRQISMNAFTVAPCHSIIFSSVVSCSCSNSLTSSIIPWGCFSLQE